jgi:hypothetical protein
MCPLEFFQLQQYFAFVATEPTVVNGAVSNDITSGRANQLLLDCGVFLLLPLLKVLQDVLMRDK